MPRSSSPTARLCTAAALVFLLAGCSAADAGPSAVPSTPPSSAPTAAPPVASADPALTALEEQYNATLGVYAIDTGTGAEVVWRADERFAFASTLKALSAAALLAEVGVAGLDDDVTVTAADLVSYSPVTQSRAGGSMSLRELAAASVQMSDNTAANLVTEHLGGPAAIDAALTKIGDTVTEVSRTEPELNEATPGDMRDTTTPRAIASSLRAYLLGSALDADSQALLTQWMTEATTGDTLIRAGVPADWIVADKSGAAGYGTRNNIAVVWPTTGAPIVIAVMSTRAEADADYDDQLIADAAAATITALR